jgi:hypothetical protein
VQFNIPLSVAALIGADSPDFGARFSVDDPYYAARGRGNVLAITCSRDIAEAIRARLTAEGRRAMTLAEGASYVAAIDALNCALGEARG